MASIPQVRQEVDGELISPELAPMLLAVYQELAAAPTNLGKLRDNIGQLLRFLTTPTGRTNANCWAADLFFCLDDGWGDVSWDHIPDELGDILGEMGGALHDTVQDPAIAENFEATPELLLRKLEAVDIPDGAF
jgi:hypothetical protein